MVEYSIVKCPKFDVTNTLPMKKLLRLLAFVAICCNLQLIAQPSFNVSAISPCSTSSANLYMSLYNPVPQAVAYDWIITAANSSTTYSLSTVSTTATISVPVSGLFTITVVPYSSTSPATPILAAILSLTYNYSGITPTVSVSGSTNSVCYGNSATLTASGASNYVWNMGVAGPTTVVYPIAAFCYSVLSYAPDGCESNMATYCMNVTPGPNLTVTASSPSVCIGTSASFTAQGAISYTWNNGPNTPTCTFYPYSLSMYTVSGSDAMGCIGIATVAVSVDTTCADVWPGDANSDGIVSTQDALELLLHASSTGAPRANITNAYAAQFANNWSGTISNGKNKCHADCNGDGVVDANDTLAIFTNFNMAHAFKPGAESSTESISLQNQVLEIGRWNSIPVLLGNTGNNVQSLGVDFELSFEQSKIVPDSVWLEYTNSAYTNNSQNLFLRKTDFVNGKLYAAIGRTDGNNVSIGGQIASLHVKLSNTLQEGSTLNISVSNAGKVIADRTFSSLSGDSKSFVTTTVNISGIAETSPANSWQLFPIPANDVVYLKNIQQKAADYFIYDLTGRLAQKGKVSGNHTSIDIRTLPKGMYCLQVVSEQSNTNFQLIKN